MVVAGFGGVDEVLQEAALFAGQFPAVGDWVGAPSWADPDHAEVAAVEAEPVLGLGPMMAFTLCRVADYAAFALEVVAVQGFCCDERGIIRACRSAS